MSGARQNFSALFAVAGLAGLALRLLASPPAGSSASGAIRLAIGIACAAPLLLLIATALRRQPQWGAWVAVVLVPYVTLSVGAMLASSQGRVASALFAGVAVCVFFAGIDAARRRGGISPRGPASRRES